MPSVYTIQGAGNRRKRKRRSNGLSSPAQKRAQSRLAKAAKKCKGLKGSKFRKCVSREAKKR